MKRWTRAGLLIFVVGVLCTLQTPARADDDDQKKMNATVAFGRGLNTNQPGNLVNHVTTLNHQRRSNSSLMVWNSRVYGPRRELLSQANRLSML